MSVTVLQQRIREKKTPLALGLRPELDKLSPKILKNFTDMFGPGSMAEAEACATTARPCWTRRRRSCPPSCSTAPATCATA